VPVSRVLTRWGRGWSRAQWLRGPRFPRRGCREGRGGGGGGGGSSSPPPGPGPKEIGKGICRWQARTRTRMLTEQARALPDGAWRRNSQVSPFRGGLLSSLGCSLDPPTFASTIKCHQKSTSNSAESSVGSLAPPRANPRSSAVCTCRASTSLAPLYSPCASSASGWGSKPNSRSAPAPVESSPGLVLWPVPGTRILFVGSLSFEAPNRDRYHSSASQSCVEPVKAPTSPTKSREVTK
jgi:hypothetical protein